MAVAFILSMLASSNTVHIFYKDLPPSLETLAAVEVVLEEHAAGYTVSRHLITDPGSEELIALYGLPETHFPFAVVINGKVSAMLEGGRVDFVHFPHFMHGIGRHEGNWSLDQLEMVLDEPGLLMEGAQIEELDETGWTECTE